MISALLRIVAYGALNRYRGTEKKWLSSDQSNRCIFWAIPVGSDLTIGLHIGHWGYLWVSIFSTALIFSLWAGQSITGWGKYTDLGTTGGTQESDMLNLIWRGTLITAFAGAVIIIASLLTGDIDWKTGLIIGLAGALMSPAEWIGRKLPTVASWLHTGHEWGEVITGAFIAAVFSLFLN